MQTIVLDLGNSCLCYGCRMKTSRIINKLSGIREHSYNLETNQMRLIGTVDPDVVVRKIAKFKKHVKVSAVTHPQTHHMPPPENHHGMTQPPPPPNGLTCSHPPPCGGPTNGPPLAHGGPTQGRPPPPSHPPPHHGHSCLRSGCDHVPPTPAVALPTGQPPRQSVHKHAAEKGKSPSCHHPPSRHTCVNGPPPPAPSCHHHHPPPRHSCVNGSRQRTQHLHNCHEPPPPSAHRCPPPQHNHNAATHHPPPQNNPADQLDKFIHGSSSPLIPRSILGHLAKIPKQKNVELIQKKGIKFRFQDGHVKSSHPINHMEFRPGHNLPQHHQQPPPPRHFSDENLNSSCTIM